MDIFKLIFEHDMRLDKLRDRQLDRSSQDISQSLEDFLKPDPTYSRFYFTGTRLPATFGLNQLAAYPSVVETLHDALRSYNLFTKAGEMAMDEAFHRTEIGEAMIFSERNSVAWNFDQLRVDSGSNVGHKKEALAEILESDDLVIYKEQAHNGFDLHLFSRNNIYPRFFHSFQSLLSEHFRFFSINGKRMRSERIFYFETWSLGSPPHGIEEVYKNTVL